MNNMQAREALEGQRYILPDRLGNNVVGIHNGWNHNKEYVLFLLEKGKERVIKIVLPGEELENA